MTTPTPSKRGATYPSALEVATYAMVLLEDNPLFNSGHGAVFTRDGINELEASVMVSRGYAKRGVGVTGLRRVKNPILLARKMLEQGESDLTGKTQMESTRDVKLDIPSAQGHTLLHGPSAEALAEKYGLDMVEPSYFFTQTRWDEHVRALEGEKLSRSQQGAVPCSATWSSNEYLPQGTCGAVALDSEGIICTATSTGGMTNKLTGRIGDTPSVGAGFWAEEWQEEGDPSGQAMNPRRDSWTSRRGLSDLSNPMVELGAGLRGFLADCFPTPFMYQPLAVASDGQLVRTRSAALSGTGNGDSFLRVAAVRTVVGIARWGRVSTAEGLRRVAGPGGELQQSAGGRWGVTGEGEGGMIGVESVLVRDRVTGAVVEARGEILQDYNCGGMYRAWIDNSGAAVARIFDGTKDRKFLDKKQL
jgi:L-asparaginase